MRTSSILLTLGLAFSATSARAQLVRTTQPITYTPLPSPTMITTVTDDGQTSVTSPFPIHFFNNRYTSLSVGHNGAIFFPSGRTVSFSNSAPGGAAPNDFIAPFWDDLQLFGSNSGYIGYEVQGTAPNRTLTVEYRNISAYNAAGVVFSMQVRFFEGRLLLEVDYGSMTGSHSWSATMAMEDSTGSTAVRFAAGNCTASCVQADFTALSNMRVVVEAVDPELSMAFGNVPAGGIPGTQVTGDLILTNLGTITATSVVTNVYFSSDQIIDPSDFMAGSVTVDLPSGDMTVPVTLSIPTNAPDPYYNLIARIDVTADWTEIYETNNDRVGPRFGFGSDFSVSDIVVPPSVEPGGNFQITTTIAAIPYNGAVDYRLWLSSDSMLGGDTLLGAFTVNFIGQQALSDAQTFTFPVAVPSGQYYVIAEVDQTSAIDEVNETNNSGVSLGTILNEVDFRISDPSFTPDLLEVGEMVEVTAILNSAGVPFTGNVPYAVFISPDATLDPGDQLIYSGTVFLGGLTTAGISATFPVPPSSPGMYQLFVVADPMDTIDEALENNNFGLAPGDFAVQGADLRVAGISGSPVAFIGRTYEVTLALENVGIADARNFQYAYYLSEDESIRIFDTQVFVSPMRTIAAGTQQTFVDEISIPSMTATASLYLGVLVDIFSAVTETNPNNNIGRIPVPLRIVFPIPDLTAQIVETPTVAAAGEQIAITRHIVNTGVADANLFDYTFYLSTNAVISTDDFEFGGGTLSLAEGADDFAIDVLTLPSSIPEATYYIGMIVDPANTIEEVSDDDNTALGPQIPVFRAAIQFATDRLPNAILGVPYEVGVYARGGPLPITWGLQSGALPGGLSIDPASGIIRGTPTEEGLFEFVLRASSGTAYSDKPFAIRVSAPTVELEIASPSLPSAIKDRPYQATLIAVGGNPPYTWETVSRLPEGLTFTEDGVLSGMPTTPGDLPITFEVRDSINNSDSKLLTLSVLRADNSVQITQVPLPRAIVGMPYCEPEKIKFEAQNGVPPYEWSIIGDAPAGMSLNAMGEFCGTPELAGPYLLTVRAQDATGLFDTALFAFEVSGGNDLTISTFGLADGQVGVPYAQKIEVQQGVPPYTWSIVAGAGDLPPGITLATTGTIAGTPTMDGTFAFVVQCTDAQLRVDMQPLSITVAPAVDTMPPDGGCGCTATERNNASGWFLLLCVGFFVGCRFLQTKLRE